MLTLPAIDTAGVAMLTPFERIASVARLGALSGWRRHFSLYWVTCEDRALTKDLD